MSGEGAQEGHEAIFIGVSSRPPETAPPVSKAKAPSSGPLQTLKSLRLAMAMTQQAAAKAAADAHATSKNSEASMGLPQQTVSGHLAGPGPQGGVRPAAYTPPPQGSAAAMQRYPGRTSRLQPASAHASGYRSSGGGSSSTTTTVSMPPPRSLMDSGSSAGGGSRASTSHSLRCAQTIVSMCYLPVRQSESEIYGNPSITGMEVWIFLLAVGPRDMQQSMARRQSRALPGPAPLPPGPGAPRCPPPALLPRRPPPRAS